MILNCYDSCLCIPSFCTKVSLIHSLNKWLLSLSMHSKLTFPFHVSDTLDRHDTRFLPFNILQKPARERVHHYEFNLYWKIDERNKRKTLHMPIQLESHVSTNTFVCACACVWPIALCFVCFHVCVCVFALSSSSCSILRYTIPLQGWYGCIISFCLYLSVLSSHVLSCLVLSCPVLIYPVLTCPSL